MRVRAWPLELINGAPLDPGATAEHVEDLRTQVAPDLFRGFDPDRFPSTSLPALALAASGYRLGDEIGEAVSLALRYALFETGLDISSPSVLGQVARDLHIGLVGPEDESNVEQDRREGEARGVKGSPHFFCENRDAFCPSLHMTKDDHGQLHVERDVEALDEFLAGCFQV